MPSQARMKLSDFNKSDLVQTARIKTSSRNTPSGLGDKQTVSSNDYSEALLKEEEKGKRNGKYNAKKTTVDGIVFDSAWEAKRYSTLKVLEKSGDIQDLELQVAFVLEVNGVKVCTYKADFVYQQNGAQVVEDAKGVKTPEYNLKKKLMKAIHGIEIKETYRPTKKRR